MAASYKSSRKPNEFVAILKGWRRFPVVYNKPVLVRNKLSGAKPRTLYARAGRELPVVLGWSRPDRFEDYPIFF
jgi:hypothetical protein